MQKLFSIDELYNLPVPVADGGLDFLSTDSLETITGYEEHGSFRFWTEIHANQTAEVPTATGFDYVFAFGMDGNGTDTNVSLITWETSYDTGGGWKTDEFYYTKQHPDSLPLWPRRRIGWCFSTFSTNRGTASNGTAIGLANLDNVQFNANQPSDGAGSKAGWNYINFTNDYSTGTSLISLQSHASNYGQVIWTCSSDGLAENITGALTTAVSSDSVSLSWLGGSLSINGTNKVAAFATTTLQATSAADGGASPAGQFFNSNPNLFGYNTVDCRTQSSNQVASIGFWNQNTNRWRVGNNGISGANRFVIVNDALETEALGIDIADNTLRFGTRTPSSDAPITGYITIKDAAGNTRKLAVID